MLALLLLLGCLSLLLAAALGWCALTRTRRGDALLHSRHHLAESHEHERLTLARTLHDGPVQDLHALRMRLSLIGFAPGDDPVNRSTATITAEVAEGIQGVIRDLRRTSEALRPPTLAPFGVGAALQAYTDRLGQACPALSFSLDLDDDAQALPLPVRLALFRIAQAALARATAREARRISVAMRLEAERVFLEICDDGTTPILPDSCSDRALHVIHERAGAIGALVQCQPTPSGLKRVRVFARRDAPEWRTLTEVPL